jgi:hypothetical protein
MEALRSFIAFCNSALACARRRISGLSDGPGSLVQYPPSVRPPPSSSFSYSLEADRIAPPTLARSHRSVPRHTSAAIACVSVRTNFRSNICSSALIDRLLRRRQQLGGSISSASSPTNVDATRRVSLRSRARAQARIRCDANDAQ